MTDKTPKPKSDPKLHMPRFTLKDYETAIENLQGGMQQLVGDARHCMVCGDSGHMAYECRHNPLLIMLRYNVFVHAAEGLHEALHAAINRDVSPPDSYSWEDVEALVPEVGKL